MELYLIYIIIVLGGLGIGFLIGSSSRKGKNKSLLEDIKREGKELLQKARIDAETIKKEKILEAKEHFIELKSKHEIEITQREKKLIETENRIRQKESHLQKQINTNSELKRTLHQEEEIIAKKQEVLNFKEKKLDQNLQIQICLVPQLSMPVKIIQFSISKRENKYY